MPGERDEGMMIGRRALLGALAAVPLLGAGAAGGLQDVAGRAGMLFGAAVRANQLFADADFRAAVTRECGSITPEIELKWAYVEPAQGQLGFTDADRLAAFAGATGKAMHGHALLWDQSIPDWARQALADQPDWALVKRFLSSTIPRFGAVAHSWDVVNEPMDMGHRMDGLRVSPFLRAFGPDYIRRALEDAHLFAPHALLCINEYGLDYDLPDERDKRYLFLKLLEGLKKAGAPIGGVGLQAHLHLDRQPYFREQALADFLNELGGLGLQIRISEMDVQEADGTLPMAERDRRIAEAARRYLDVAADNRAVGSIGCWGLSDRYSWLTAPMGGTAVGLNRGLPLDSDLRPKPMRAAIAGAFARRAQVNIG
jgi:endo-1,4-beta-xylanase